MIVALKHPRSNSPPRATKLASVRSATRPLGDMPQVTQRSQKSRAAAPQLVTALALGRGRAAGHRQEAGVARALIVDVEQAAYGEIGHPDASRTRRWLLGTPHLRVEHGIGDSLDVVRLARRLVPAGTATEAAHRTAPRVRWAR